MADLTKEFFDLHYHDFLVLPFKVFPEDEIAQDL